MRVKINNKETELMVETVAELAKERNLPEKGVALAINNEMVPRCNWTSHKINEGDDIVILKAFAGG